MSSQHIRFDESDDSLQSSNDEDLQSAEPEKNDSDDKEEVFGVYSDNESSDIAMSDVEGQEDDDDIPDIRAWGKGKKKYYSTDYVDKDYNTYQGKDALLADLEEEEAKQLQLQLVQQLQDTDFYFDMLPKQIREDATKIEETVITDVSKLTKRQKMDIFRADAPEFFGLVEDSKRKFTMIQSILHLLRNGVNDKRASDFLNKYLQLILKLFRSYFKISDSSLLLRIIEINTYHIYSYLVNIGVYFLLKSSKVPVKTHPVIKRLYQYKQLLDKTDKIFHQITSGEMPSEYQETQNGSLSKTKSAQDTSIQHEDQGENELPTILAASKGDTTETTELKRPISYQIAKNKGLLPRRKKEQRNPRVKNRMKYRKAKIRRKGAVREVRKELSRYGGEISGIKATVKKSISIKS